MLGALGAGCALDVFFATTKTPRLRGAPSRSRLRLLVSVSPSRPLSVSQSSLSLLSRSSVSLSVSTSSRARLERTVSVATRRLLVVVVASRRVPRLHTSRFARLAASHLADRIAAETPPHVRSSFYHRPTVRISRPTPRTASRRRARRRASYNTPVSPVRASRAATRASWRRTSKRRSVSSTHPSSDTKILSDVSVSDGSIGRRRKRNTRPRTRAPRTCRISAATRARLAHATRYGFDALMHVRMRGMKCHSNPT